MMAANRRKLTRRLVEGAQPARREVFLWDAEVTGFGLKLSPSGRRVYVLQYRFEGISRRYTIGRHGSPWTVEGARKEALRLLGRIASGHDVQLEKVRGRSDLTVGELCDLYLADGMRMAKPVSIQTAESRVRNHIKPLLGRRKAASLLPVDVERLLLDVADGKTARRASCGPKGRHARVRGGKAAATSAVSTLSAALSLAVRRGLRRDNPALAIRKFPGRRVERFLSAAELARLGEVLSASEALGVISPFAIAALRLLVLTGCRKNEILKCERAWVDEDHSCLRLPDSKTGARVVRLGEAAMEVIRALPVVEGNRYLLPGRRDGAPISDLQSVWETIREAAGIPDVRVHDLRHSFASFGAATGESLVVVGALLGHKVPSTTQRYTHLSGSPMQGAADRISGEVARLLGLPQPRAGALAGHAQGVETPAGSQGVLGAVIETRWMDTIAAAAFLGYTSKSLEQYRYEGFGPPYRKVGRRVVYALGDLQDWRSRRSPGRPSTPAGETNVVDLGELRRRGGR